VGAALDYRDFTDDRHRTQARVPQSGHCASAHSGEHKGVVTYDEAARWLKKIGGTTVVAKDETRGRGSIIVSVESAKGRTVSRHRVFDDTLVGLERERAVREAFTVACEELKVALG